MNGPIRLRDYRFLIFTYKPTGFIYKPIKNSFSI